MISVQLIMFLMLPWFIGQFFALIGDGLYIGADSSVTTETGIINNVMDFFVPEERSLFSTISAGEKLFTESLPRAFMWDYSFLSGDYEIFRYILLIVLTVPLVIGMVIALAQLAQGIFKR